ncbi:hypothetical protein CAT7_04434 [Carnobacterium sp. AT7]|nr:hypothetical protein CAT7_04434 [Carnobacterium sp. AT7]
MGYFVKLANSFLKDQGNLKDNYSALDSLLS